jgi:hypothetical protein
MSKRQEPVRKTTKDMLDDLHGGHREAASNGPAAGLKYLMRTLEGQQSLPNGVKAVAWDLIASDRAALGDWAGVDQAVRSFLALLPAMEEALGHGFRAALLATTVLERGVQARTELGDFPGALDLCDRAIALDLGAHWESKRESLDWAR